MSFPNLAQGMDAEEAVEQAKEYMTAAIRASFSMGGHGPLHHFWQAWGG